MSSLKDYAKRNIKVALNKCTESQRAMFIYTFSDDLTTPMDLIVDELSEEQLRGALLMVGGFISEREENNE